METEKRNKLIAEFMGGLKPMDEHWVETHGFYHTSWDWLMPVVEKIEKMGVDVIINRFSCQIRTHIRGFNKEGIFPSKIESTWYIIIDYIKWYNENNKYSKPKYIPGNRHYGDELSNA